MKLSSKKSFMVTVMLVLLGQFAFALASPVYLTPRYEGSVYATTGVHYDNKADLHALTDAAHYFGQTIIGWTKFPEFVPNMITAAHLPMDAELNAHMQERQNIIFTVSADSMISKAQLQAVKDYLQSRMDEYNRATNTQFIFTNVAYEQNTVQHSYAFGAGVTLLLSLIVAAAGLFVWKELA